MSCAERPDNFEQARAHLQDLSDEELHTYFRELVDQVVTPLIEEARTYTTPSIERSVLLRMGFSSVECKALVAQMQAHGLLGHGAGRLVLELARVKGISLREAGLALLAGQHWDALPL
jgi:D-ornithine 4,5-aminomutase subunit alpha